MHGPRGPLEHLDPPAPSPPILFSKLPFSTVSVRYASQGFPHAGPGGRRIREGCAHCRRPQGEVPAWSRLTTGRSKHSVHWRCKRRLLWDSGSRCRMLELGSNGFDKLCMVPETKFRKQEPRCRMLKPESNGFNKLCMVPETRFRKQEPRGETRPRVAVPAWGRPEGPLCRNHHK